MSTLTKILVVLVAISTIFLCGIIVTYVANAENYKKKYEEIKNDRAGLQKQVTALKAQEKEKAAEKQRLEEKLRGEIALMKTKYNELQSDFKSLERRKITLEEQYLTFASTTEGFEQTNAQQRLLLTSTLEDLDKIKAEQIKLKAELDETSATLLDKMAIIQTLDIEKKQLLEEKTDLRSSLDKMLVGGGQTPAEPTPVTKSKEPVKPVREIAREIGLKGLVSGVDLKNSMASISIGKADGVKEGMKFHVTRGDDFVCDILIIHVEDEEAVGVLELVQQTLEKGDNAATNF